MTIAYVQTKMEQVARSLRARMKWANDGYYTSELDSAKNAAVREVLEGIVEAIDSAFDVDSASKLPEAK